MNWMDRIANILWLLWIDIFCRAPKTPFVFFGWFSFEQNEICTMWKAMPIIGNLYQHVLYVYAASSKFMNTITAGKQYLKNILYWFLFEKCFCVKYFIVHLSFNNQVCSPRNIDSSRSPKYSNLFVFLCTPASMLLTNYF